jgi:hypothetical protein
MSPATDFIDELLQAVNEVERLQQGEARRLLSGPLRTIRDLRTEGGIPPTLDHVDDAGDLLEAGYQLHGGVADAEGVRKALLKAATHVAGSVHSKAGLH